ncbi:hypothetical protein AYI68_g2373 [Smittium mucronatum]|uniref:Uncharacterized protein n=1 Tax=Smittium mucronatum TaxID=133383 RepID=A0A1R0GND1_9FUNG|nr:hypothetical protein AYI68_g7562 [Smittium mucronatum]OLY83488.1 hypothetical protein AYI68_g2373 [Smittium mucronatum]
MGNVCCGSSEVNIDAPRRVGENPPGGQKHGGPRVSKQLEKPEMHEMTAFQNGRVVDSSRAQGVNNTGDSEDARIQRAKAAEERLKQDKYRGVKTDGTTDNKLLKKLEESKNSPIHDITSNDPNVLRVSLYLNNVLSFLLYFVGLAFKSVWSSLNFSGTKFYSGSNYSHLCRWLRLKFKKAFDQKLIPRKISKKWF